MYIGPIPKNEKKRQDILKAERQRNGGSHYVIHSSERHNPFQSFKYILL